MSTYRNNFNSATTLASKQAGEAACYSLFKDCYGYNVTDVRNDDAFRKLDVDFICSHAAGGSCYVEAKCDNVKRETGNIIIETVSNSNKNTLGWGLMTSADYITIYQPNLGRILLIDGKRLKNYLTNVDLSKFKTYQQATTDNNDKTLYYSYAVLISESKLKELRILLDIVYAMKEVA